MPGIAQVFLADDELDEVIAWGRIAIEEDHWSANNDLLDKFRNARQAVACPSPTKEVHE